MSIVDPIVGEPFTFRIVKSHLNNPSLKWENLYECRNRTATGTADLISAGLALAAFEAAIHCTFVQIESMTVSTWIPDGEPYNPDSFVTTSIGQPGEREVPTDPVGLVHCLRCQFNVESGRMGHRLYRGVLLEGDLTAPAGITVFSNPAAMNLLVSSAIDANIDLFLGDATGIIQLTMESTSNSRRLLSGQAAGVTFKKLNNKYFNRQP